MSLKTPITKAAILATLGASLFGVMGQTHADTPQYRIVNLQAEVVRKVANDEMQASLYAEFNEKDAATLANKLNTTINQANQQAKKYSQIKITTGNQNTYPIYNDKNQLTSWRGRAEINLNSQDFKATSELIAKLQENLQLQNISFTVSKEQRQKVENELYVEASKAFQQRANLLLNPWNASGYELVNLNLNTQNSYRPPVMMAMANDAVMMKSGRVESQNYEAGDSEITVIASGSVQLK